VEQALKAQDLKPTLNAAEDEFDNNVPKGAVLSVSPSPGTQLKLGDVVTIVVSKGPAPLKPLPDVRGRSENEARDLVREAGWQIETVRQQFDPNVDGGKVISTTPGAGQVSEDKKVTLIVSNAVTVPDLRNKRLSEAKDMLDKLGLNLDVAFGGNDGRGRIFGQSPNGGSRVQKGSAVRVGTGLFGG
jgi:serine/threonine-protein kinase